VKGDGDDAGVHDYVRPVVLETCGGIVEVQIIKENVCASCSNRRCGV
jgi:hypothetical protein